METIRIKVKVPLQFKRTLAACTMDKKSRYEWSEELKRDMLIIGPDELTPGKQYEWEIIPE